MKILQQLLNIMQKITHYWINDIRKRQGCVGKSVSLSMGLFIILMACSVPIGIINSVGQAVGIIPTATPDPTATAVPTKMPTLKPLPTATPRPTATATPTLEPVAITATAEMARQETVVSGQTATAEAEIARQETVVSGQTATAEAEIAAQQTVEAAPTRTAEAIIAATATIEALETTYPAIDVRELAKAPDRYQGQNLKLRGEVFSIQESASGFLGFGGRVTRMQIWVKVPGGASSDREAVVVEFAGVLEGVFEKDIVLVYGKGAGTFTGTNAFGAEIVQPAIRAEYVRW